MNDNIIRKLYKESIGQNIIFENSDVHYVWGIVKEANDESVIFDKCHVKIYVRETPGKTIIIAYELSGLIYREYGFRYLIYKTF